MTVLDSFAHGLIGVFGVFARIMLGILGFIEGGMRALMKGVGLNSDMQTVILIFVIVMFLLGVLRLLHGRIRLTVSLILILVLAHTLEGIARGSLG